MKLSYPNTAIEELVKQRTKNPIFVHYIREHTPGYHNRSHRKAIGRAYGEYLMYNITNIDPYDTPWIQSWSILDHIKNVLNVASRPLLGRDVFDVGFLDMPETKDLVNISGSKRIKHF